MSKQCNIIFWTNVFFISLYYKICFPIDNHCKSSTIFPDRLKITRIFWYLIRVTMLTQMTCMLHYSHFFTGDQFSQHTGRNCDLGQQFEIIPHEPATDHESCKVRCASRPDCGGFVIWSNHCHIKALTCAKTMYQSNCCTTYLKIQPLICNNSCHPLNGRCSRDLNFLFRFGKNVQQSCFLYFPHM